MNRIFVIFYSIFCMIFVESLAFGQDRITTSQFMAMLNTCAAGSKSEFRGDLLGSVKDIYDGQGARGRAVFSTEAEFLKKLPESQKFEGYRLYVECIKSIVADPSVGKARIQLELLEGFRSYTVYNKVIEAYGQPAKIKKVYSNGRAFFFDKAAVEIHWFEGVKTDVFVVYTTKKKIVGVAISAKFERSDARIPYLNMGLTASGPDEKDRDFRTLDDFILKDMSNQCNQDMIESGHARFGYYISNICYFGAPGGYMSYQFVFQPTEKDDIYSSCKIYIDGKYNLKNGKCQNINNLKPDLAIVYFEDGFPKDFPDIIMEWIYNFAQ